MQTITELSGTDDMVAAALATDEESEQSPELRIDAIKVVIVDNLLKTEDQISEVARREPGFDARLWLKRERYIAGLALENITQNVRNLAKRPEVTILHLSEVDEEAVGRLDADAVVLSGTLRDFDYYRQDMLDRFRSFIERTSIPVLGICGGHQLVGLSFGAEVITLDKKKPSERRENRLNEYQYRYVKILADDPIFDRIDEDDATLACRLRGGRRILRVWQNHGLMVDRVPEGFQRLASGYLCPIQMMVRRSPQQLIYTVQFHIEKSFEDYGRPKSFWDHHVESRDGRIIFENFLIQALRHRAASRCSR